MSLNTCREHALSVVIFDTKEFSCPICKKLGELGDINTDLERQMDDLIDRIADLTKERDDLYNEVLRQFKDLVEAEEEIHFQIQ